MESYCGPAYFPLILKKMLSKRFNSACQNHDRRYDEQQYSRSEIDKVFLNEMRFLSKNKRETALAYIFYAAVRTFGWISWELAH